MSCLSWGFFCCVSLLWFVDCLCSYNKLSCCFCWKFCSTGDFSENVYWWGSGTLCQCLCNWIYIPVIWIYIFICIQIYIHICTPVFIMLQHWKYILNIYIFCFLVKKCLFLMRIYKVCIFNIHFQCCKIFENRCVCTYLIYIFNVVKFLKTGVYVHMYIYSRALLTQNPKERNTLS